MLKGIVDADTYLKASHRCAAVKCRVAVRPDLLMCRPHWRMVPQVLKRAVWDAYKPGQSIATATTDYLEAVQAAIKAVAEKEGRAA